MSVSGQEEEKRAKIEAEEREEMERELERQVITLYNH